MELEIYIILELQLFSVPHEHSKSSHALQTLIELNASNRVSSSIRKKSIVETLNRLRFKRAARINPIREFEVDLDARVAQILNVFPSFREKE